MTRRTVLQTARMEPGPFRDMDIIVSSTAHVVTTSSSGSPAFDIILCQGGALRGLSAQASDQAQPYNIISHANQGWLLHFRGDFIIAAYLSRGDGGATKGFFTTASLINISAPREDGWFEVDLNSGDRGRIDLPLGGGVVMFKIESAVP